MNKAVIFDEVRYNTVKKAMDELQLSIIHSLEQVSGDKFELEHWKYSEDDGGGRTGVVTGKVLEKGGVNFSALKGSMNPKIAEKMQVEPNSKFCVTGVSLVIHPMNPFVPTTHANVRFFDMGHRFWFGGGIDLTPHYPYLEDVLSFHQTLKDCCDRYGADLYPRYKKWCDEYFWLKHREEARGVGGIFFDYVSDNFDKTFAFTMDVGKAFNKAYDPLVTKRKSTPYGEKQKEFQKIRRGRYAEFNLIYDRGTQFGFETKGRTESILMSMPPEAIWKYNWAPAAHSEEHKLLAFLQPTNWLGLQAQK